jgi:tetratricopeptide (TPR) repeat protein
MNNFWRAIFIACICMPIAAGCGLFLNKDPEEVYERALALVEAEKFPEAQIELDKLKKLRPMTVLDHGLQARINIAAGKSADAIYELAAIPDDHPLAGWARLRQGQLHRQRFEYRMAENDLKSAIQVDPGSVVARRELVFILGLQLRRSELSRLFLELSHMTTLSPKEVWVWCMVRDLVWWVPEEQIPMLQKAIAADPGDHFSHLALVEVLKRNSKVDEAIESLNELPADLPEALAKRLEIEIERNDTDKAAELFAKIPADSSAAAEIRGRLSLAEAKAKEAIQFFEKADQADPGRRQVLADLGRAWMLAGDREKGLDYARRAARVDALNNLLLKSENSVEKSTPEDWLTFSRACEAAGRLDEARAWLALVIQANPLDSTAQAEIYRLDTLIRQKRSK